MAVAILLSSCVSLKASDLDSTITIIGKWPKSSAKKFEITRCLDKSNSKDGRFLHQCSIASVKVTIEDSTHSGYVIDWLYDNITLDDSYNSASPVTKYITQITKGMTIKFLTDSVGTFKTISNWDDIKTFLTMQADSMHSRLRTTNIETIDAVRNKLLDLINSKDQLQTVLLQDIQLYFSLYGYTLNYRAPMTYNGFFPNMFGGDPLPTIGKVALKSIDVKNNTAEVTWHQQADSAQEKQLYKKTLDQQAITAGKPTLKDEELPNIKLYDDYYFLFDLNSGWAQKLTYRRTTATDKMQQVDSVEFKVY